jgi:Protein of unknown function (DUF2818)
MGQSASVWLVIAVALLAANLPFLSQRLLAIVPLAGGKNLAIRLAELVLLYFVVGGLGLLLEKRLGQIAPQGWEFYAITGTLFITLAFPGFVWRYLLKHRD